MRVAIVGSKDRCTEVDRQLVGQLVEQISQRHFDVIFICTNSWVPGIGQFVRQKCVEKAGRDFKYQVIIVDVRTYSSHLSRNEMASIYLARNASVYELADVLYYLASPDRRGTIEDLVERMEAANRPVKVLLPGDPISLLGE